MNNSVTTQVIKNLLLADSQFHKAIPASLQAKFLGFVDQLVAAISPEVLYGNVSIDSFAAAQDEFLYFIMGQGWDSALAVAKGYDMHNTRMAFLDALKDYRRLSLDAAFCLDEDYQTEAEFMVKAMGIPAEVVALFQEGYTIAHLLMSHPRLVLVTEY